MAGKRLHEDSDQDIEQSVDKRMRRLPSFSTVIREAMMAKHLHNIFFVLEPLFRKVVQEEVEIAVSRSLRSFQRSNSLQIEAAATETPSLKLVFKNQLSLPIFTGSKIESVDSKQLEIAMVDAHTGEVVASPVKVEVVVLDGDFASGDQDKWTCAEFQHNIVKERTGRRPLLTGDVSVTMKNGSAVIPELSFTDNSSWIRSRHFRIGARVVAGSHDGRRIMEAMTEPFMVKDHRGELYRKHYPPALADEVWRLERIGKDGAFHRKLSAEKIFTVQDFLKLLAVDPQHLRSIMGPGMSDRVWETTVNHARTCDFGEILYRYQASECSLLLNPICEVVAVVAGSMTFTLQELSKSQRGYIEHLVREAYQNWDKVEEADALLNQSIAPQNVQEQLHEIGMETMPWYQAHQGNVTDYPIEGYGTILDPVLPCFD